MGASHRTDFVRGPQSTARFVVVHSVGRYLLSTRLSSGATGDLFVARDGSQDGPPRLLKLVHESVASSPHFARLLHTEAPAGTAFRHPSAVRLIEAGRAKDTQFIVVEMVRGQPLSDVLRRSRVEGEPLGQREVSWIGAEVARVLAAAHAQPWFEGAASSMVHGAVSPRGIIVGYDGSIKLTGLGYGRARSRVQPAMGRMAFAAPEVLNGRDIVVRTDIYGLGVTLHFALAGRSVYRRPNLEDTRAAVLAGNAPPLPPRSLRHPEVGDLLRQMMAPRADARPETMAGVEAVLRDAAGPEADFAKQLGDRVAGLFADEREAQNRRLHVSARPKASPPKVLELALAEPPLAELNLPDAPDRSSPAPAELQLKIDEPDLDREQERARVAAVLRLAAQEAEERAKRRAVAIAEAAEARLASENAKAEADRAASAAGQQAELEANRAVAEVAEPAAEDATKASEVPRPSGAEAGSEPESGVATDAPEPRLGGFSKAIFGKRSDSGARAARKKSPLPSAVITRAAAPVAEPVAEPAVEPDEARPFAGLLDQAADAGVVDHLPEFSPIPDPEDSLEVDIVVDDSDVEVDIDIDLESSDTLEAIDVSDPEPPESGPRDPIELEPTDAIEESTRPQGRFSRYQITGDYSDLQDNLRLPSYDIGLLREVWLDLGEPEDMSGRFETYSTLLARVHHPQLPVVLDVGYEQGRAFRVRRPVRGAPLADAGVERHSETTVRRLLVDLAQGLDALHTEGLSAGGIQLEDVWQDSSGRAVLVEIPRLFELAAGEHPDIALCRAVQPPEYAEGSTYTPSGDLFSLGLLGHRLLTGEDALPADPEARVLALRRGQIPAVSAEDLELQDGLRRLLASVPNARFAQAAEVVAFLGAQTTEQVSPVAEGTAHVVLVDPDVTPDHVQRVLLQRGVRAAVFAGIDAGLAELERGPTRALVVARNPKIDENELRRRVQAVNARVDLRFVPPAASRMVGPPVSLEGLSDAWLSLAPRVVALASPEPGFVPTDASRVMAQTLGLGLRAELLAGLTAAAHLLCRRLGQSPLELAAVLPEEVPTLLDGVAGLEAGTVSYDDSVPVVRVVAIADAFYRSTRLDGMAPSRALADLKVRFAGPKGLVVVEALLVHLRELYATGDLMPPASDAPRVLLARCTRTPALIKMLEFDGFQIEEAEAGDAAWEMLRTGKPEVVVLDAKLRGRNAAAIIELSQVHPALKSIRFLLIGGVDDAKMLQRVSGLDNVQIVDRSVSVEALRAHISALIFADDD